MFTTDMLANIIRYYGHAMQGLMGSYLERSIHAFHEAQKRFQANAQVLYGELPKAPTDAWKQYLGGDGQQIPGTVGGYLEKGAKAVIDMQDELRNQALKLFSGFPYSATAAPPEAPKPKAPPAKAAAKPAAKKPRARK